MIPNFLEVPSLEEANEVNLEIFDFLDFVESRGYLFVKKNGVIEFENEGIDVDK